VIDLTLQQLLLRFCALALIAGVHGVAVAGAAVVLGDPGPRYDGRLRINPLVHLDLWGSIAGVLFSIGWIKPIVIDPAKLRPGRVGMILVVAAGVAATLLGALLLRLVRPALLPLLPDAAAALTFAFIETTGQLSLWLALVNLLPLPCLTAGHLLAAIWPQQVEASRRAQTPTAIVLMLVAATGWLGALLAPAYRALAAAILGA
jgi:Zn-dependent protease